MKIDKMGYKPGVNGEFDDDGKLVRVLPAPEPKRAKFPLLSILVALVVAAVLVWAAVREQEIAAPDVSARDGVR